MENLVALELLAYCSHDIIHDYQLKQSLNLQKVNNIELAANSKSERRIQGIRFAILHCVFAKDLEKVLAANHLI